MKKFLCLMFLFTTALFAAEENGKEKIQFTAARDCIGFFDPFEAKKCQEMIASGKKEEVKKWMADNPQRFVIFKKGETLFEIVYHIEYKLGEKKPEPKNTDYIEVVRPIETRVLPGGRGWTVYKTIKGREENEPERKRNTEERVPDQGTPRKS